MDLSILISVISALVAIIALIYSVFIQRKLLQKQLTLEAFNILQTEVLDKLVFDPKENAQLIVNNLDNPKCENAYKDYKTLIARLDHFALGVNQHVYNFKIVNKLAGTHLVCLYKKIEPIITQANKHSYSTRCYGNFEELVYKLNKNISKGKPRK